MRNLLALLPILLLVMPAFAQEVPGYTDKYVNDFAKVLSPGQAGELRAIFSQVDQNTTAEMALLTVDTVSPYAMSDYAQQVFDKWKIGKADKDNGLLMLYAKDTQKIWVSTGYGLEGILPDSKVGRILDETFVPARAAGNATEGIVLAAREYAAVISENANEVISGQTGPSSVPVLLPIFFPLMFIAIIGGTFFSALAGPKCPKCGGRMKAVKTEVKAEKRPGPFGMTVETYYTLVTYECAKCEHRTTVKKKGQHRRSGAFVIASFGGGHGGGFHGGGFGGGGFGGGGAGR
ncbi:MAG: TPM domain-containing protein [Candidatus Aenigmatarchaeota archaeon]